MRIPSLLVCIGLCVAVAGCTTVGNVASKTAQVWAHPSIEIGPVENRPTRISLSIYASDSANPGDATMPAVEPIHVEISAADSEALAGKLRDMLIAMGGKVVDPREQAVAAVRFIPLPPLPPLPAVMPAEASEVNWLSLPTADESSRDRGADAQGAPDAGPSLDDDPAGALALGQYRRTTDAPPTADVVPAAAIATVAGSPVHIRVLQLRDDSMLLAADFASLDRDLKKALGSTFISADDYVIRPGSFKFVDSAPVDSKTRFIAVVASFRDLDGGTWKSVTRIEPVGQSYAMQIVLADNRVRVLTEHP
jgi:type VI secretion system protein VasD